MTGKLAQCFKHFAGHDSGEVMMWNEVPGIVRRVTNQARLRYPVQCLLSLNEDYFAVSSGQKSTKIDLLIFVVNSILYCTL